MVLIKNNTNEKGHSHHICIRLPPPSAIRTTTSDITTGMFPAVEEGRDLRRCMVELVLGGAVAIHVAAVDLQLTI